MDERESLICLNAVPGLGSIRIKRLYEVFGNARSVWKADEAALRAVSGIGEQSARGLLSFDRGVFFRVESELLKKYRACVVTLFDENYPECLKQIPDPPFVLYARGRMEPDLFPGLALVGSRRASVYGLSVARVFGSECAGLGISVISGMARGIDTAAHQGCLQDGGKTVAVLGSGLAHIYPPENHALYDEIAENGCVLSEFPMETGPLACHFPRRNRVISGLSCGVIVVEAAARSGALITCHCALEQGRDVFAVPGKLSQAQAAGANRLIQQGAKLIFSVRDAVEEIAVLRDRLNARMPSVQTADKVMPDPEKKIFHVLSDEPLYIDEILGKAHVDVQQGLNALLFLECRGFIKRLAGNYFVKL